MDLNPVLERFAQRSPLPVMARGAGALPQRPGSRRLIRASGTGAVHEDSACWRRPKTGSAPTVVHRLAVTLKPARHEPTGIGDSPPEAHRDRCGDEQQCDAARYRQACPSRARAGTGAAALPAYRAVGHWRDHPCVRAGDAGQHRHAGLARAAIDMPSVQTTAVPGASGWCQASPSAAPKQATAMAGCAVSRAGETTARGLVMCETAAGRPAACSSSTTPAGCADSRADGRQSVGASGPRA